MDKLFEYLKDLVLVRFGISGILLLTLASVGLYAWFLLQRNQLLKERIDLDAEKRRQMAEELLVARQGVRSLPAQIPAVGSKRKRILVVDDEPSVLDLIEFAIARNFEGVHLEKCIDGADAMARIRQQCPDLLILDLMMPRLTGYEVLKEVKLARFEFPIIVISGYANSLSEIMSAAEVDLPNVVFLPKPYRLQDFLKLVGAWLN